MDPGSFDPSKRRVAGARFDLLLHGRVQYENRQVHWVPCAFLVLLEEKQFYAIFLPATRAMTDVESSTVVAAAVLGVIIIVMLYLEATGKSAHVVPRQGKQPEVRASSMSSTPAASSHTTATSSSNNDVKSKVDISAVTALSQEQLRHHRSQRIESSASQQQQQRRSPSTTATPVINTRDSSVEKATGKKPSSSRLDNETPSSSAAAAPSVPGMTVLVQPPTAATGDTRAVTSPMSQIAQVLRWLPGLDEYSVATVPRRARATYGPRLLVCHDMMGGYVQDKHPQVAH